MADDFKRVTRADVAKRAQVSETIVSYVINNNRYVDKEKRRRVEEAVRELNYQPNSIARALKGKGSNSFIFIADQIASEHFGQLVEEMDLFARDKGYFFSLCSSRNEESFVAQIIGRRYDGVLISSTSFPEEYIRMFTAARLPVVVLQNRGYGELPGVGQIDTGLYGGARENVRHLIRRGRRRILYIDRYSAKGHYSTLDDLRLRGFYEEMAQRGLEPTPANVLTGCASATGVGEALRARIGQGPPVDAVFGRNDQMACIAMKTLQEIGLRVPEDVAVIGFDNSSLSRYTTPMLSTAEIPRREIGKAAVEMLHEMITTGHTPAPRAFTTRLIEREST